MLISKLFRFENTHRVRGCSTRRCSHSIHGHSYKIELLLEAHALDNGQMVYDFGLLKNNVHDLIDAFDHTVSLWSKDNPDYLAAIQKHSERWILLPVSPSAEQLSRVLFRLTDTLLRHTAMANGEADVQLHSVIVHETESGYAHCFREDACNPLMGLIELCNITFSEAIPRSWQNIDLFENLKHYDRIFLQQSRNHDPEKETLMARTLSKTCAKS